MAWSSHVLSKTMMYVKNYTLGIIKLAKNARISITRYSHRQYTPRKIIRYISTIHNLKETTTTLLLEKNVTLNFEFATPAAPPIWSSDWGGSWWT